MTSSLEKSPSLAQVKVVSLSVFAVLFGFVALVYLGTTGILPILGRDEPRYVEIGREMLNSGDWITPRLGGFVWFEKPALLYWMVAASFGVFGESEWAARLGPALCGLATAALLWWMARRTNEKSAQWSALSLATCGGMLAFSHGATFDIALTACLALALAAWWKAQEEPRFAGRFLALFWVGVGLAFLAKGLVAFILAGGTIALYAMLRRERVKTGFWWGLPLALAVSAIWYGPVIWVNGEKFINEFFVQHHFQRFTSNKYQHHQPVWFYLEMLPLLALPWSPFLVGALWKAKFRDNTPEARLRAFGLAWMIVPIAFFSLSGSKLPGYILPALPGAFLLIGGFLADWTKSVRKNQIAVILTGATLVLVALLTTFGPGVARADARSTRDLFRAAHAHNYGGLRVAHFKNIQRTAEFYAAPHLLYDQKGEPIVLETAAQVGQLARDEPFLLLADQSTISALQSSALCLEPIAHNTKSELFLVRASR